MRRFVVIAVVLALGLSFLGLLVPLVLRWRADAERARCQNNLRQLTALALAGYLEKHKQFPAGTVVVRELPAEKRLSWIVPLLPWLGQAGLEKSIDLTVAWDAPANNKPARTLLTPLVCPTVFGVEPTEVPAPLHYPGIAGVGPDAASLTVDAPRAGLFRYDTPTPLSALRDGVSTCMAVLETGFRPGPWIAGGPPSLRPVDPAAKPYLGPGRPFGGCHPGGANAAFADGSVQFLTDRISPDVLELLAGIADGPADSQ
jgi:prepilin-type processing-associated H-X9-DG protein